MQGILRAAANTTILNEKKSFQVLDDNSAVCLNQLSWSVENGCKLKSSHFSSFSSGIGKLLLRSDVELPGQAEMIGWNS